jgi:folate-binding protein YgfZ
MSINSKTKGHFTGVARLEKLGIVSLQGVDAFSFANSLLSNTYDQNCSDKAKLSALCLANGRMISSFIGYTVSSEELHLVMPCDMVEKIVKKLSMYVLRSKVMVRDVSDQYVFMGELRCERVEKEDYFNVWRMQCVGDKRSIQLYASEYQARKLLILPKVSADNIVADLLESQWEQAEIDGGVILISAALSEQYTPQMLNYESVGGVDFHKGCYPGQEVIARTQFRGKVKRRSFLVHARHELLAGQVLSTIVGQVESSAVVLKSARDLDGVFHAIILADTESYIIEELLIINDVGQFLILRKNLPYDILKDI